ncbi:MAG: SRPBCC family protein [Bacteroidota bacterium]
MTKDDPIVVERVYDTPVQRVWEALTDKAQMKQWYFDLDEFKPEPGFRFQFYGQGHKGEKYLHLCEVTEVEPLKKLTYSWAYDGYPGISYVSFELWEEAGQTHLKLTHKGLESFPAGNPDFARTSFNGGWTELIGNLLKNFLELKIKD